MRRLRALAGDGGVQHARQPAGLAAGHRRSLLYFAAVLATASSTAKPACRSSSSPWRPGAGGSGCAAREAEVPRCACATCRAAARLALLAALALPGRCSALFLRQATDTDVPWLGRAAHRGQPGRPVAAGAQVRRELAGVGGGQRRQRRPVRLQGPVADGAALRPVPVLALGGWRAWQQLGRRRMAEATGDRHRSAPKAPARRTLALALQQRWRSQGLRVARVRRVPARILRRAAAARRASTSRPAIAAEQTRRIDAAAADARPRHLPTPRALMIAVYSEHRLRRPLPVRAGPALRTPLPAHAADARSTCPGWPTACSATARRCASRSTTLLRAAAAAPRAGLMRWSAARARRG